MITSVLDRTMSLRRMTDMAQILSHFIFGTTRPVSPQEIGKTMRQLTKYPDHPDIST